MDIHLSFDPNPAKEADALTAFILDPKNPPPIYTCQAEGDKPYVIKSLLRRAQVLEHLWFRLIGESLEAGQPKVRGELARQAHAANKELMTIQSALYKIQRDNGLQCVRPTELLLADAPPPPGLTNRERVQVEMAADEVYEAEFNGPSP
ncbi:hypothetical protein [Pusillimonas sp. ANT_WB101]|uniref:hypothetical protein n=1 Tax=Pusillimonas sp. ANT_WB101 TaxID=2597356 RepID=UPI0011ECF3E4|nr:hypothetical protein [Pusillimonas sp. ANT_WB101]KAA0888484.1 hypothetical protein FQ179_21190 [Pusillimonas sp. ANT_WB101]